MVKAHKIQLNPTKTQKVFFAKSFGVARFSYNWALNKWQEDYKNGIKQTAYSLIKHLNSIKNKEYPWMQETGKTCSQYAIHNLESAYKKMWKEKAKYPKFKKKGMKDSFVAVENKEQFKQIDFKIWIPRLGWVKCHENLRFEGKINNVVVKRIADKYFAVVNIEVISNETLITSDNQTVVGVDLGISSLAVLSDGTVIENPRALRINLKRLKRHQRNLCRKVKGGNNQKKQQMIVAKLHYKISCIRKNAIHQATSMLINNYGTIVIEDLNVKGMIKNHNLAQSIVDAGFGEFRRQLTYKTKWNGNTLVIADRFYASSKICNNCGNKKETLKLSERTYKCSCCGYVDSRDSNAAKNLANLALPTNRGNVKPVEQTQVSNLLDSVAMKQEIILNNLKF